VDLCFTCALQIKALFLLVRAADQPAQVILRFTGELFQIALELVFVHWKFQEVKRPRYGSSSNLSVRLATVAPNPGMTRSPRAGMKRWEGCLSDPSRLALSGGVLRFASVAQVYELDVYSVQREI
jgi:peptide deformylase